MLIAALVMAGIGLAALVTAVVTSNEVIAWVCIGASAIGVILLIVDAVMERQRADGASGAPADEQDTATDSSEQFDEEYPDEAPQRVDLGKLEDPGAVDDDQDVDTGVIDLRKASDR